MSVSYSQSASLTVNGLTTANGSGITLLANPSFSLSTISADDYLAETYTINPNTPETPIDLGLIVTGQVLWVQTSTPILLTLNQPVSGFTSIAVSQFCLLNSPFSSLSMSNPGGSQALVSLVIAGNRQALPATPGVF